MSAPHRTRTSANGAEEIVMSLRERVRSAAQEIESQIILETLEKHHWNRRKTAETLQISYRLLMLKMKNSRSIIDAKRAGN